jgi:hypothetical protein
MVLLLNGRYKGPDWVAFKTAVPKVTGLCAKTEIVEKDRSSQKRTIRFMVNSFSTER